MLELLVVIAVILILTSLAVPIFQGAKLSANETNALGVMRAIASAQASVVATPQIDTDGDGAAEYGYFGELAGTVPARISAAGLPVAGVAGFDELTPSMLIAGLGQVNGSVIMRGGYVFQLFLPAATVGGAVAAIAEDPTGGKQGGPFPDPNNCEVFWVAYGWPIAAGRTGNLAMMVNQSGTIMQTLNRGAGAYSGVGGGPTFDAVFTQAGDMSSNIAVGVPAVDGNTWTPAD